MLDLLEKLLADKQRSNEEHSQCRASFNQVQKFSYLKGQFLPAFRSLNQNAKTEAAELEIR